MIGSSTEVVYEASPKGESTGAEKENIVDDRDYSSIKLDECKHCHRLELQIADLQESLAVSQRNLTDLLSTKVQNLKDTSDAPKTESKQQVEMETMLQPRLQTRPESQPRLESKTQSNSLQVSELQSKLEPHVKSLNFSNPSTPIANSTHNQKLKIQTSPIAFLETPQSLKTKFLNRTLYTSVGPRTLSPKLCSPDNYCLFDEIYWELNFGTKISHLHEVKHLMYSPTFLADEKITMYDSDSFLFASLKWRLNVFRNRDNTFGFTLNLLSPICRGPQEVYCVFKAHRVLRGTLSREAICIFPSTSADYTGKHQKSYRGIKRFCGPELLTYLDDDILTLSVELQCMVDGSKLRAPPHLNAGTL